MEVFAKEPAGSRNAVFGKLTECSPPFRVRVKANVSTKVFGAQLGAGVIPCRERDQSLVALVFSRTGPNSLD
jgi:hypothetical protein